MTSPLMPYPLETFALTRRFGRHTALDRCTLQVPTGSIYGLFGPNGAGKSTLLRLLLGLDSPTEGRAECLGRDTRRLRTSDRTRLGYATENQSLPGDSTLDRLLAFCRFLYPTWDRALEKDLLQRLELPRDRALRTFSRGMQMKAALLLAVAYRPDVLILDEPYSGLDPVVRDDLTQVLLHLGSQHPWTIVISTHDLPEVEGLVDHVGFLQAGRLQLSESIDSLRGRFRRLDIAFGALGKPPALVHRPSWVHWEEAGPLARVVETQFSPDAEAIYRTLLPDAQITATPLSLREIYSTLQKASSPVSP